MGDRDGLVPAAEFDHNRKTTASRARLAVKDLAPSLPFGDRQYVVSEICCFRQVLVDHEHRFRSSNLQPAQHLWMKEPAQVSCDVIKRYLHGWLSDRGAWTTRAGAGPLLAAPVHRDG